MAAVNLISVEKVWKAFPERPVLEDVTFGIDDGDRLGVIGLNGSGKSTLLGLLAGTIEPDQGRVVRGRHVRVAMLEQEPHFDPSMTLRQVTDSHRELIALVDRLGLTDLDVTVGQLSGGQRRRLALAETLATEAEVTILDEPTNHLDVDVIDWMEEELAARSGALVIVTHDRYLLDRVASRILEIDRRNIHTHRGTYEDYIEARARREAQEIATERKRQNLARIELEWLRRSPKARTSKSKARIDAAHALFDAARVEETRTLELALPARRIGNKVVDLVDAGVRFGDRWVLRHIERRLPADARIGVVGPNGAGKTTLLRLMAGRMEPSEGHVVTGDTIFAGWFGQHPEPLPETMRVLDAVREIAEHTRLASGLTVSAGQLLERFGFTSAQQSTLVGELSGGERRRLELLRMLAGAPNLLLLDEPTNDLDLETLGVLEAFLDSWPGAVVAATHDRYFLERVCHEILSIEPDGSIRHHPGGWAAYRAEQAADPAAKRLKGGDTRDRSNRYADRLTYKERRELQTLERKISELESRIETLTAELERTGSDWEAATSIGEGLAGARTELAAAEDRWLELSERA